MIDLSDKGFGTKSVTEQRLDTLAEETAAHYLIKELVNEMVRELKRRAEAAGIRKSFIDGPTMERALWGQLTERVAGKPTLKAVQQMLADGRWQVAYGNTPLGSRKDGTPSAHEIDVHLKGDRARTLADLRAEEDRQIKEYNDD